MILACKIQVYEIRNTFHILVGNLMKRNRSRDWRVTIKLITEIRLK
jgi:hypothetical protein